MNLNDANAAISHLTLPSGFTAVAVATDDGTYIVHVENSNGWICEFSYPDHALWAQQQINLVDQ